MFPHPPVAESRPCRRCARPVRADRLIHGYGSDCAERLGLTGGPVDTEQTGPDLFDTLNEQDGCDGWDRDLRAAR